MRDKELFLDLVRIALNFQSINIPVCEAVSTYYRATKLSESCIPPSNAKMAEALGLPTIDKAAIEFVEWSAYKGEQDRQLPKWMEFESEEG